MNALMPRRNIFAMISRNLAMKVACEPNPLCALSANSLIIAFNLNIKRW